MYKHDIFHSIKLRIFEIRGIKTLILIALSCSTVSCINKQVLSFSNTGTTENDGVRSFDRRLANSSIPCVISVSAPENMPGQSKRMFENPFSTKIYYYPLKAVLQSSFEKALYQFFSPPDSRILDAFSVEISTSEAKLELSSEEASYSLSCLITLREPNDKIINTETVQIFEKSPFDRRTAPRAISQATDRIAEIYMKGLLENKRLSLLLNKNASLRSKDAVVTIPHVLPSTPVVKVEGAGVGIALIIGISNYDILGPLLNCREDAEAFYKMLTERGYAPERVVLLTDIATAPESRATYTSIERRIKQVCEFSTPKDSLLIYFAGHGTSIDGESYLIPQDGDEKNRGTSISLTKLQQQMQNSKAGRKLLVLDACHSGSATRGVTSITPSLKTVEVHVMASCAENELSHPDPESKHGIFTRYLLEGMNGKADTNIDGKVTQKELFEYVNTSLIEWGLKTGKTQRPQMLSPTPEDIVISKVPAH